MSDEKPSNRSAPAKDATPIATTRAFTESCPDGFVSDAPEWVVYCPECGAKLPLREHVECSHYRGTETGATGEATAIDCAYAREARIRPRAKPEE